MTKKWYVYMLQLSNRAFYTGITNDVDNRMQIHSEGKGSKYVRSFLPFKLVYLEEVGGRSQALRREIEIKRLGKLKKLVLLCGKQNKKDEFKKWAGNATMTL